MPRRVAPRWNHPIARFARSYGISNLSRELRAAGHSVSPSAIYKWIAGRHPPEPKHAVEVVRISGGQVSMDDIYRG